MKKSFKIIITSCIAAIGIGASFGGAFALYTKNANPTEFSIGTYTHTSTGSITYKIGDISNSIGTQKIDLEHKSFTLKAPLGGVYSNDIPAQSSVYGSLAIKATIDPKLVDHVRWSVYIEGYEDNTYWGNWEKVDDVLPARKYTDGDEVLTKVETEIAHDLVVKAVENPVIAANPEDQVGQVACIYVDFPDLNETNFLTYAEASFRFDFTFGAPTNPEIPTIRGDKNNWSGDALEYRMIPNIEADTFQWKYDNLVGFAQFYIHHEKADSTIYYVKAQDGDNVKPADLTATYSVYYNGSGGETGDRNVLAIDEDNHVVYQA